MPWYIWTIIALTVISSLLTVATIGRPRQPMSAAAAIGVLVVNGLIIWGIIEGVTR